MKDKKEISFYHFTSTPLIVGLPRLIKKIYESKQNLLVVCKSAEEMNELDKVLWTFASREFIPHAIEGKGNEELQPILFSTSSANNKNSAEILLSTTGEAEDLNLNFKKYLYAFYGNPEEVREMNELYQKYKSAEEFATVFWKQDQLGKWAKID